MEPVVVVPPPVGALVEAVRRSVGELRSRAPGTGAGAWPQAEREEAIGALDGLITELTLYRGQVLRCHEKAGAWGSVSDRDFADYRSRTTGTGRGVAMGEVALAEGLEQLPALAEAVEGGKLHLEHARALTRLHRDASPQVQQALTGGGGLEGLVAQAARDKLTAPQLGKAAKAWAAKIDAAAAQRDFEAVRARRSFTMRRQGGGVAGEFFLDPVAGEELRTALEAIAGRPGADDERSHPQRMADALSTMAGRTLQVGSDLVGAQVRPHLALLVSQQTWAAICARRRVFESCPDGERPPWPNVAPAELEDGTTVAPGELERLMCDSEVTRMVMDATGIPLDVGRTQRTYTKELRRAVLTRDRHCMWPRCALRASWCEVHHITWFSRGGHTSLAEAITLCTFHHHRVHEADIRITALPSGFDFHHPTGTHIGTTTRDKPPGDLLPCPSQAREAGEGQSSHARPGSRQSSRAKPTRTREAQGNQAPHPSQSSHPAPRPSQTSHALGKSRSPQVHQALEKQRAPQLHPSLHNPDPPRPFRAPQRSQSRQGPRWQHESRSPQTHRAPPGREPTRATTRPPKTPAPRSGAAPPRRPRRDPTREHAAATLRDSDPPS